MLFNSLPFVAGFLPPVLFGYWLLARHDGARLYFLLAASLFFYGYWNWRFAFLLLGSIAGNWLFAEAYFRWRHRSLIDFLQDDDRAHNPLNFWDRIHYRKAVTLVIEDRVAAALAIAATPSAVGRN